MEKIKRYLVEQFPKNKTLIEFSPDQLKIRNYQKFKKVKTKKCNQCGKQLPLFEFYTKKRKDNKIHYDCKCRDCRILNQGCLEIGKLRFSRKIFDKGFRRCSVCKEIKPLSHFNKSADRFGGYSYNCYECSRKLVRDYVNIQSEEIGDFYVKQYAIRKGISELNDNVMNSLRNEIIESRKPKYFLNDLEFVTKEDFSVYIYEKYKIPKTTTLKRLDKGVKEIECTIPEKEFRRLKNGANKGMIEITDTVTKEVFLFFNSKDIKLLEMFGFSTIHKGLKTGLPVGGKKSKYKNPCIIKRINNGNKKSS